MSSTSTPSRVMASAPGARPTRIGGSGAAGGRGEPGHGSVAAVGDPDGAEPDGDVLIGSIRVTVPRIPLETQAPSGLTATSTASAPSAMRRPLPGRSGSSGIVPLVASAAEAKAAMEGSSAFWKQNPYRPGTPQRPYQTPPPRAAPTQAQEDYPDTGDLQYRGRVRHAAGWDFEHSAYVLLIDKHGVQRLGIPFEELDAESLAGDIRVLRSER